jgi:hypothetical protein
LERPGRVGYGGFGERTLFGWLHTYSCKFATAVPKGSNTNWTTKRPGLLHSLIGLITTLINIYTAQGGHWSAAAKITVIMIGVCTGNMSMLYLVYNNWILEKMKTTRDRAFARKSHD